MVFVERRGVFAAKREGRSVGQSSVTSSQAALRRK